MLPGMLLKGETLGFPWFVWSQNLSIKSLRWHYPRNQNSCDMLSENTRISPKSGRFGRHVMGFRPQSCDMSQFSSISDDMSWVFGHNPVTCRPETAKTFSHVCACAIFNRNYTYFHTLCVCDQFSNLYGHDFTLKFWDHTNPSKTRCFSFESIPESIKKTCGFCLTYIL